MTEERMEALQLADGPVTTHVLKITFIKSDASEFSLNIDEYKSTLTSEQIAEQCNAILAENVFAPGGLSLIKADHATKVDTTKTLVDFGE